MEAVANITYVNTASGTSSRNGEKIGFHVHTTSFVLTVVTTLAPVCDLAVLDCMARSKNAQINIRDYV